MYPIGGSLLLVLTFFYNLILYFSNNNKFNGEVGRFIICFNLSKRGLIVGY